MHNILSKILSRSFLLLHRLKYALLSDCKNVNGSSVNKTAVLITGSGIVTFGTNVNLGVKPSPFLYNTYIHIEARKRDATIVIGNNVFINNNATLISEGEGIFIGNNTLAGPGLNIYDTDFHELHPQKRLSGNHSTQKVIIGNNVFIGSNVTVLKGVTIGDNSIIATGSVVVKSIPGNCVAGGNPCKVIKEL